jgi:hypothetical protein
MRVVSSEECDNEYFACSILFIYIRSYNKGTSRILKDSNAGRAT